MDWINLESMSYWFVFTASFLGVAVWETIRPKQELTESTGRRWGNHSVIMILSNLISMGLIRGSPVVLAVSLAGSDFGLLNKPWLPPAARWIAALLLLDFVRYATHRTLHAVPLLWRLHQVHHSDPDMDVSTALRFHPLESVITHGAYLAAVVILAPPAGVVLVSELLGVFQSFFEHANVSLPQRVRRWFSVAFFSPDTHRIHHSEEVWEQNRNFGQVFTWWDRLFHTYSSVPAAGQDGIIVGLRGYQNRESLRIAFMLAQPFRPERNEGPSPASTTQSEADPAANRVLLRR
jgi:sterol desaturase/sphingolipid hydroxylase (fatty acid hydroxylase superfamily)